MINEDHNFEGELRILRNRILFCILWETKRGKIPKTWDFSFSMKDKDVIHHVR